MNAWRTMILARRRLACLLVVLVLFAKVLVPTGYMFTETADGFIVEMCGGQGAMGSDVGTTTAATPVTMMTPMPMMTHMGKAAPAGHHDGSGKVDAPCAFSGIGMAAMAAVDAALLIAAIAFVMALGALSVRALPVPVPARLRPPLRAPPAYS